MMNDTSTLVSRRDTVVIEARRWIGTPYMPHQQVRGGGCDCATLLVGVYGAVGVIERFVLVERVGRYAPEWNIHQDKELYLEEIIRYCDEVSLDEIERGDVLVFTMGRVRAHAGIVTETRPYVQFVHSYNPGGVHELVLNPQWRRLLSSCYRPKGLW